MTNPVMKKIAAWGFAAAALTAGAFAPVWPPVTRDMKPWCYNWWMGSAVDAQGLSAQADALGRAGFGGFHVIPIYGAKGYEPKYKAFLSAQWMRAFALAVEIAGKRDLGVDLTMGSGWCFGGPQLRADQGCRRLFVTADEKEILPSMEVVWQGPDANGKKRYLVSAFTGQQVKRAGLGGQGPMMDPFSVKAMDDFLKPYTASFDRPGAARPEHFYHDSYEYFRAAWTPDIFEAFRRKRGYDLRDHLAELAGVGPADAVAKVKCDYRETLSDLIIEDVFPKWFDWCRRRGIATRNEAHGASANWLDFYALADIPETEMFGEKCRDVLVSKFASSAAHLTGKPMVSSESCTWLNQHFHETLAEAKMLIDRLFLSGVNHMFYHGTCYSPVEAPWPGWCFYAACQMNPRNSIWRDVDCLNNYITRCQSVFRAFSPDNDVLLYWPLHDYWMNAEGYDAQMTVHNAPKWFNSQPVGVTAAKLYDAGYAFDYVSDRLLAQLDFKNTRYRAIVVPPCKHMPKRTQARLKQLAAAGMKVYYDGALPTAARREEFNAAAGLMYTRYCKGNSSVYFLVNQSREPKVTAPVKSRFRPSASFASAWTMDPLSGRIEPLAVLDGAVTLSLAPGHSTLLYLCQSPSASVSAGENKKRQAFAVKGPWTLEPVAGGPEPWPAARTMSTLSNWAVNEDGSENPFSGTMRYRARFDAPHLDAQILDLGRVHQSARAVINGVDLGKAIMAPYELRVPPGVLKAKDNVLELEITSVSANRIRWMDKNKIPWRTFHDINFASYSEGKWKGSWPFDAAKWPLTVNGLLGPVTLK